MPRIFSGWYASQWGSRLWGATYTSLITCIVPAPVYLPVQGKYAEAAEAFDQAWGFFKNTSDQKTKAQVLANRANLAFEMVRAEQVLLKVHVAIMPLSGSSAVRDTELDWSCYYRNSDTLKMTNLLSIRAALVTLYNTEFASLLFLPNFPGRLRRR